jgi:hypothetical protein
MVRLVWPWIICLGLSGLACDAKGKGDRSTTAANTAVAPRPVPLVPSGQAASAGFDSCLVGSWKAVRASLKVEAVSAEGGGNVAMDIAPTGAAVLDFTPMSEVEAAAQGVAFAFRYSGKATGVLETPRPGELASKDNDYSKLTVTAMAKVPGQASVPLFKETPVTELQKTVGKMAGTIAPGTPSKGIETSPVLSMTRYVCSPQTLALKGTAAQAEWTFTRL